MSLILLKGNKNVLTQISADKMPGDNSKIRSTLVHGAGSTVLTLSDTSRFGKDVTVVSISFETEKEGS